MKTNVSVKEKVYTHEGALSTKVDPLSALKRSVMACMLWEDNFYEDGKSISERIHELCSQCQKIQVLNVARKVHSQGLLRHVPLWLILGSFKAKGKMESFVQGERMEPVSNFISNICTRPDQMTELLSLYWKDGKKPIPSQMKKGLAQAFCKFDEYQLAKYNRDAPVKLKDVLFLCHAKPKDDAQAELWKRLISGTMKTPDTWEVRLSSGQDKKESFEVLLKEGKMGRLAVLRNLRNMYEAKLDKELVRSGLLSKSRPLLPFQFIQAAKHCPQWEDIIDESMLSSLEEKEKLQGVTVILVDVSGSMTSGTISSKSEATPQDAASGLAILLREVCERYEIFSFSNHLVQIPPRRGMALRDAIKTSQPSSGTFLGQTLNTLNTARNGAYIDRVIVITDEQTNDTPPEMKNTGSCYILNVSNCKNGIKNNGQWTIISGFSEASIDYIREIQNNNKNTPAPPS